MNYAAIWHSSDCLSKLSELTQVSKFIDSDCCFWWHALLWDAHCYLSCLLIHVLSVQHLSERSHCFWSWKTIKKLVFFPLSALQKLLKKIFNVCVDLTQFKVKLDVDTPYFQACHFLQICKSTNGTTHIST